MAYDEDLADRLRGLLGERVPAAALTETRMFGGLALLVDGHMTVCASGREGVMVRVPPTATEEVLATTVAGPMVMRDRPVKGWVLVAPEHVADDADLAPWVDRGLATVRDLPPKPPKTPRR